MSEDNYTIPEHWDTEGMITAKSDAAQEFAIWETHAKSHPSEWTGNEFCLQDFETYISSIESGPKTAMVDIYATGGTAFCVRLIEDYDPSVPISSQDGKRLGSTEFGAIDDNDQYVGDDDGIIEHVRSEYDLDEEIPAKVR